MLLVVVIMKLVAVGMQLLCHQFHQFHLFRNFRKGRWWWKLLVFLLLYDHLAVLLPLSRLKRGFERGELTF